MFSWDKPANQSKRFSGNPFSQQGVEHSIAKERARERDTADMNKYATSSMRSNQEAKQMTRAEGARRRNASLKRAGEQQLGNAHNDEASKSQRNMSRKKDLALARELAVIKRQEEKREREIQAICNQDPSLRELNEKIKTAYVNRDREVQIKQKHNNASRIKSEQEQLEREMEQTRQRGLEEMAERAEVRRQVAERQKVEIQQQLRAREANEQLQAILTYQAEKVQVEELIKSVYAEQRAEAKEMERQAELMKQNMRDGLEIQKRRAAELQAREDDEDRRISQYKQRVEHRNDAKEAEKKQQDAIKERIRKQIEDALSVEQAKEERMRDALHLLGEEEADRRRNELSKAKREKITKMREEMMRANLQQQHHKVVVKQEEQEFENDVLRRMQRKFDEDEVVAKRKEMTRRAALQDYKHGVGQQMRERSDMYHAAQRADALQVREAKQVEDYKAQIIEEARKRILQAHAAQLQGYLPKGVLAKESDLEFLSSPSAHGPRGATR